MPAATPSRHSNPSRPSSGVQNSSVDFVNKSAAQIAASSSALTVAEDSSLKTLVHRCRFIQYQPQAIQSLAFSPSGQQLALVRQQNSSIELYAVSPASAGLYLEKTIPGSCENSSIQQIIWTRDNSNDDDDNEDEDDDEGGLRETAASQSPIISRLFSSGLDGLIREWDTTTLVEKYSVESNGGAVWCMAASSNGCRIAIGCEDGCVRLFKITCLNQAGNLMMTAGSSSAPLLEYVKTFDKADARILSICWNSQDTAVIVGTSDGNIRTLDATSGRVIQRISVDSKSRSNTQQPLVKLPTKKKPAVEREMLVDDDDEEDDKKNVSNRKQTKGDDEEETLVWAVQALQDGKTIVSGDSLGHVCFWDAQSGTLRQLIKAHLADVLCLAANKEGTIVYSSGVDRVIVQHRQVPTKLSSSTSSSSLKMMKWIPAVQRRYHSHDVRALALNPSTDMLVSGGVDTTLIVSTPASKFDHVKQRRMPLWPTVQGTGGVGGGRQTVSFVKEMRWMVEHCRDGLGIRVWTLGTAAPTNSVHCAASLVHRREKLIIDMTPALSTSLTCSAVSADGAWIAVSDAYEVKVFAVTLSDDGDSVARVSRVKSFGLDLEMGGASALTFVSDQYDGDDEDMIEDEQPACGTRLVVCGLDSIVRVFEAAVVADSEDEDENEDVDVQFILLKSLDMHTGSSSKSNSTVTPLSSTNNDSDAMDLDLLQVIETDKEMAAKSRRQQQKSSVSNAQGQQTILSVVASDDGKWLVTGDSGNRIVITNLLTLKLHATLPNFPTRFTSLTLSPNSSCLAITLADPNSLHIYSIASRTFTSWSRSNCNSAPKWLRSRKEVIAGGSFVDEQRIMLWGATFSCLVDLTKPASKIKELEKKRKRNSMAQMTPTKQLQVSKKSSAKHQLTAAAAISDDDEENDSDLKNFIKIDRFQPLMLLEFASPSEMVVVERPLLKIMEALPEGFFRDRYGT